MSTRSRSAHQDGLPELLPTSGIDTPGGHRKKPIMVISPASVMRVTKGIEAAEADDIRKRTDDDALASASARLDAIKLEGSGGVVHDRCKVKAIALEVTPGGKLKPALGGCIESQRSVAIVGNTRRCGALLRGMSV